ncbi:thiamine pyrophosphate-binding protein [Geodermatophilus sabuli]|uniref:Acetolactate synthase large subunit n=1 Tax=Geodermatophilus sabuli TaxID=1564158 RepID=A0A285E653_9ACTN|nr:thiamine pyrophosphate-binding protein [Geodermatophilus sabuli]MBB3082542.1 thiamine pyrophosphate-dependent acetolactate synthase large subunit-like protein [Geodermatophilus sabuli]SNX94589.1 Acetolactate synthase large subunit [Geodermatophilus sabuli]
MQVAEAVGRTLAQLGVRQVFGVVGSGNFHVTNALIAEGARFVATRHEHGAAVAADAYARATGEVSVVSLHQGCGLTNALTGITEAAKSRTPVLVVTGDTSPTQSTSNFWIEQELTVRGVGATSERVHGAGTAVADAARAYSRALLERRTVVLHLALDVQKQELDWSSEAVPALPERVVPTASADGVRRLADLLAGAERPVLVAGRGALGARAELEELAEACGALLTTSAVARGLFVGNPWDLDVMGGFATPTAADLISDADVLVSFGAGLNTWTTRAGGLIGKATTVAQVDLDLAAIGHHRDVQLGIQGDCASTAAAVTAGLTAAGPAREGYRSPAVAERLTAGRRWQDEPYDDTSDGERIDPRTLTIALDEMLPRERVVVPDGGNFNGYPAMFLEVPDNRGYCLPLAFQSIGMALSAAIGAAVATPDRLTVCGIGDGGFMMALTELDTAVRLALPLVVVVYDDAAYGAEVHHFPGYPQETVVFPDTDLAAIARGFGCTGVTVRTVEDLDQVRAWLAGPRTSPLLIDAKITSFPSWVLAHSFADE